VKETLIQINRLKDIGVYTISDIFPGLEEKPILLEIFGSADRVPQVLAGTKIKVIQRQTYMFVDNDNGTISIGKKHLQESDDKILYLDIIHELVHVRQHLEGLNLYDRSVSYVDRPTEIEAYAFTVDEARRIGLNEEEILDYLNVEWITAEEHNRLARRLNLKV